MASADFTTKPTQLAIVDLTSARLMDVERRGVNIYIGFGWRVREWDGGRGVYEVDLVGSGWEGGKILVFYHLFILSIYPILSHPILPSSR